jgi:hypothetical protein
MLKEPLRLLNLFKERLRLLENKDNRLGLCRDIVNNPGIPDDKNGVGDFKRILDAIFRCFLE